MTKSTSDGSGSPKRTNGKHRPTSDRIEAMLSTGPMTYNAIVDALGMDPSEVSAALAVMRVGGLIHRHGNRKNMTYELGSATSFIPFGDLGGIKTPSIWAYAAQVGA